MVSRGARPLPIFFLPHRPVPQHHPPSTPLAVPLHPIIIQQQKKNILKPPIRRTRPGLRHLQRAILPKPLPYHRPQPLHRSSSHPLSTNPSPPPSPPAVHAIIVPTHARTPPSFPTPASPTAAPSPAPLPPRTTRTPPRCHRPVTRRPRPVTNNPPHRTLPRAPSSPAGRHLPSLRRLASPITSPGRHHHSRSRPKLHRRCPTSRRPGKKKETRKKKKKERRETYIYIFIFIFWLS